jgi:tricarballylate dehydrogenase
MGAARVVVCGGGNAALCAAIAARRRGAEVVLLEGTSKEWRGGNSKYTRNIRVAHDDQLSLTVGAYSPDELVDDLRRVTGPELDLGLAHFLAERSQALPGWMSRNGIRWQPPLRGTLQLERTNCFFLGGGKALLNTYYRLAESLGVDVRYEARVTELRISDRCCSGVRVERGGQSATIEADVVIVATGGFESNLDWLRELHGPRVDNYVIRGSSANDGVLLRWLLTAGAAARGNAHGHHAIAVDARSPRWEGGIVTRVDSIPFSVVVNQHGQRFADEGEDIWPRRYASWGSLIAAQPGQRAFSIFDATVRGRFIVGAYQPISADSLAELASKVGLPVEQTTATVAAFNRSLEPAASDLERSEGTRTAGIQPPKSSGALSIDQPPFYCLPVVPGITFTYLAVGVAKDARVLTESGEAFENLFAAGELVAGNILSRGYLAGIGMTIGSVFGIIAGEEAAAGA